MVFSLPRRSSSGGGWPVPLVLGICSLVASACAPTRSPERVDYLLSRALSAAHAKQQAGMDAEAAVMLNAVASVDPSYPGLAELDAALDPAVRRGMDRGLLGMNRKLRPRVERSGRTRALLWLPDRLLDLLDVATFGVHMGTGLFADAHVTRAGQVSGGLRSTGGLGVHDHRSIGMKSQAEAGLTVIAAGAQTYGGALVGTSGTIGSADSLAGLHNPSDRLYQEFRDYWAVGASATLLFIGVEVDLHPLQLADWFAGFAGIDFLNDDFGRTRSLRFDAGEPMLLREVWNTQASKRTLEAYRQATDSGALVRGGDPQGSAGIR